MNYTTTLAFANEVKSIIDDYWKLIISNEQLVKRIKILFCDVDNRGLALRGTAFTTSFSKVLGKKRIAVIKETLKSIDAKLYNNLM